MAKETPVTFHVKNKSVGTVTEAHAKHIRLVNLDNVKHQRIYTVGQYARTSM